MNDRRETRIPVNVVRVVVHCDKCNSSNVKFDNIVLTSYPAKYTHTCSDCGNKMILDKSYPYNEYKI